MRTGREVTDFADSLATSELAVYRVERQMRPFNEDRSWEAY